MTHTPGPWKQSSTEHGDEYAACVVVDSPRRRSHGAFIARAEYAEDTGETESNARLIAAAPELLEALEEAFAAGFNVTRGPRPDWRDMARAAIAKAKGG